jgi:hypothetical protein
MSTNMLNMINQAFNYSKNNVFESKPNVLPINTFAVLDRIMPDQQEQNTQKKEM